jgi:hypothetical protein
LRLADGKAHARIWRKGHDAVAAWQKLDREPAVGVRRCAGDYGAAGGGLDGNDRSGNRQTAGNAERRYREERAYYGHAVDS